MALVLGAGGVGGMRLGRVGCENGTSLPAAGSRRYSLLPLHGTTLALWQYGASVLCKDSKRIRKPVPKGHSRDVIPSAVWSPRFSGPMLLLQVVVCAARGAVGLKLGRYLRGGFPLG